MINQAWEKSQFYSCPKGYTVTQIDQRGETNQQCGWKLHWNLVLPTCSLSTPSLPCDFPKGKSSLPSSQDRTVEARARGHGSWWKLAAPGFFLVSVARLHCGREGRSLLFPSSWFRRCLILELIAWGRKNSVGKFGPWSEPCVCPLMAVGDDICFIMTVLDGIVVYWEKPDYDLLLSEQPSPAVILPPLPQVVGISIKKM